MFSATLARFDRYYDRWVAPLWLARQWDGIDRDPASDREPLVRADFIIAVGLGILACAISYWGFTQSSLAPAISTDFSIYLQADVPRVIENLTDAGSGHDRTDVHPLSAMLLTPFGSALTILGFDPDTAAMLLIMLVCSINVALVSLILRLIELPRLVAGLFTALFMASSSFLYWGAVVELSPFACLSILFALFLMVRIQDSHTGWWVAANVVTLGITTPNWVFGLVATAVRHKLRSFFWITFGSFMLVVVLSIIQNYTFHHAAIFFRPKVFFEELIFLQPLAHVSGGSEFAWNPFNNLRNLYITTVVAMPAIAEVHNAMEIVASNQRTGFPAGEVSPIIAVVAWVALFGLGVWGAVRHQRLRLPMIAFGILLLSQSVLYGFYGEVTFLYGLHVLPLLIPIAACAWFSAFPRVAVGLCCVVIVAGATNNVQRFQQTIEQADCVSEYDFVKSWQRMRGPEKPEYQLHSPEIVFNKADRTEREGLADEDLDRCNKAVSY